MLKVLDLYCGDGGATRGYENAGFVATGVDINAHQRYCGSKFIQSDAIEYMQQLIKSGEINEYDLIHASPPCQAYSRTKKLTNKIYPELIEPTRNILIESDKSYIIENVIGAPLINPIMLCGAMFGLMTYRHRLFECSFQIVAPPHPIHIVKNAKMGRQPKDGEFVHVVGNACNIEYCKIAMGINWMTGKGLVQSLPPKYTEYIGTQWRNYYE